MADAGAAGSVADQVSAPVVPLTKQEIRKCFDVVQLAAWKRDPANKACVQGIAKRIDVIMTMEIRASKRNELTAEQQWELQQFEEQFRTKNA